MTAEDLVVTPRGLRFRGRNFPCSLGRTGTTAQKHEGDGATPRGHLRITACLFRPDRIARPNTWSVPILRGDLWSDDSTDPDYNHWVREPHDFGHERLRRADRLYDLVLLTDWNWPDAIPDRGSAIFLHRWRKPGHPTEGCVALQPDHLRWIAGHIAPGTRLIVR